MIVRGIDRQAIEDAASGLGLEFDNMRPDGRGWAFRLVPRSSRAKFARRSGSGRRLKATCYHGFRDFHLALWRQGAKSITTVGPHGARITYKNVEQFRNDLQAFAIKNVGTMIEPAFMIKLCECDETTGTDRAIIFETVNAETLQTVKVREIQQSAIMRCPFVIIVADHYREDGSCKCDDAGERAMMISEWEYSESDFNGIELRA